MNDERDPSSNDPLDDWLVEARWPEPTAMSTGRLRARWLDLRSPRRSRSAMPLAMAASIIVVIGAWAWWANRQSPSAPTSVALNPFEQPLVAAPPTRLPGREMTGLERTLVEAQKRKEELAARKKKFAIATSPAPVSKPIASVAPPVTPPASAVAMAPASPAFAVRPYLDRVADPQTRGAALAELDGMKSPPTGQLFRYLSDSHADLRLAAAWALGRIDGPVTTRRLIGMVERNESRREALMALASSRGRDAQLYVRAAAESEQYAGIARSAMIASEHELQ